MNDELVRKISNAVIGANTAGAADNAVRELLAPVLQDRDVERYYHATAVHAKEREQEYRRTLWAAARMLWPEPLRVSHIARDMYDASADLQIRSDPATRELLIYALLDAPPPVTVAEDREP